MLSNGHIASGLSIGLLVLTKYQVNLTEFIPGIILGSVMPDIDTGKSWVSQSIPLIDDKLRKFKILKHRGVTHGLTGIIASLLIYLAIPNHFSLGFSIGYITHCVTDLILTFLKIDVNTKTNNFLYNIFWVLNTSLIGVIIYNNLILKGVL